MNIKIIKCLILFCTPNLVYAQMENWRWLRYYNQRTRILELMQLLILHNDDRIKMTNDMRFMYEESPFYEVGYVMGEIIEKYRKMTEIVELLTITRDHFLYMLKRCEQVQHLYFEIYHLVNILHEIPRKYENVLEFAGISLKEKATDPTSQLNLQEMLKKQQQYLEFIQSEERKRKRYNKKYQKLNEALQNGNFEKYKKQITGPPNKVWPLDYGWEIDPNLVPWPVPKTTKKPKKG